MQKMKRESMINIRLKNNNEKGVHIKKSLKHLEVQTSNLSEENERAAYELTEAEEISQENDNQKL